MDKQSLDKARLLAHSMVSHPVAFSTVDHVEDAGDTMVDLLAEVVKLRNALTLAVQAMRAPLDDWKGECERKALDAAHAALGPNRY